jgi:hypothetical protein
MTSNQPSSRPVWLTETLIIAGVPVLAYIFAYVFELAYFAIFDAPRSLITVDVMTILAVGTFTLAVSFSAVQFYYYVLFSRPHAIFTRVPFYVVLLFNLAACLGLWLFLSVLTMFRSNQTWQAPLVLFILMVGDDWQRRREAESGPHADAWKTKAIASFVLGISFVHAVAFLSAAGGEYYQVAHKDATLILLRRYGDRLVCVKVDPATRVPSKEFVVLPFGSDDAPLELSKFGTLNVQP